VLSCESVSAQWYLFPGRKKRNANPEHKADIPAATPTDSTIDILAVADSILEAGPATGEYTRIMPDTFKVALILPFQSNGKPSSNFLEMYSGALLAIREAGLTGKEIELTVVDESDASSPLDERIFEENHLVIGPVNFSDIREATILNPDGKFIVSPLEPKAATLVDSSRIIQAPAPWMRQADEVARWIASDMRWSDELVVFKDTVKHNIGEQTRYLLAKLDETGCKYRTESRISEFTPSKIGTTRIVIASDRDSYINGMVRDLSVIATQKQSDIVLYGTSSVRGSLGVDIEHLHNLQAHYTTGYFIDYENSAVRSFILSYRALFKTEPGQFAFQGYDTMHYFLGLLTEYGEQWYKKLSEHTERGLQTDYYFKKSDTEGKINTAVRNVVLGKDLSATLSN